MAEPCTASGLLSVCTSLSITSRPSHLVNLMLHPGSGANPSITVYDSNSGAVLALLQGVASGASVVFPFDGAPVLANGGMNVTVAGTGAQAEVYYKLDT